MPAVAEKWNQLELPAWMLAGFAPACGSSRTAEALSVSGQCPHVLGQCSILACVLPPSRHCSALVMDLQPPCPSSQASSSRHAGRSVIVAHTQRSSVDR